MINGFKLKGVGESILIVCAKLWRFRALRETDALISWLVIVQWLNVLSACRHDATVA